MIIVTTWQTVGGQAPTTLTHGRSIGVIKTSYLHCQLFFGIAAIDNNSVLLPLHHQPYHLLLLLRAFLKILAYEIHVSRGMASSAPPFIDPFRGRAE